MRQVHVYDAVLDMPPDADIRAPGAAITVALCGSWDHQPPCPLAPHRTDAAREGAQVRLRVLFAAEPEAVAEVERRIEDALDAGSLTLSDGTVTLWHKSCSAAGTLRASEVQKGQRLADS